MAQELVFLSKGTDFEGVALETPLGG